MGATAPYGATEGGEFVVNTIQSSPNTPLRSSKAGMQRVTGPPRSPDHVLIPRSAPFLTSASLLAGEVQECHSSRSALTSSSTQQTEPAHTAASSPPVECESDPLPSCHVDTSAASILCERYLASTRLLWGTACVFFRTAALEILEQRVAKRKFRRICEAVADCLRWNLAARVTTVTFPIQPSQFLTTAVAFAFPKQRSRLLVTTRSETYFHASALCDELNDDSETSPVPAKAPLHSLPKSHTSGTGPTNASHNTDHVSFALSLTGRREANSEKKALRAFLVQGVSVCDSGNTPGELAFRTCISPVQTKRSRLPEGSSRAASPVSRPQVGRCLAAASSTREGGGSEQAAYTEGGQQSREDVVGGAIGPAAESSSVKQGQGRVPPCHTGKHTDSTALGGGDETEKRRGNFPWRIAQSISADGALASLSSSADEGSPRPLLEEAKYSATRVAAVATDGGEAVQAEQRGDKAARVHQGISDGEGGRREKTAAPDVATAAPACPVAKLSLQQLTEAMSAVDSYCSMLGMQLRRFYENMSRLQLLAQEENFTPTEAEGFTAETHNSCKDEGHFVRSRAGDNDTCVSNSNAGRCHDVCRNSSSGIDPGAGEELSGCRRQVDLLSLQATRIVNRDDIPIPDSSVATHLLPFALHPQRETILPVLEQVRPLRDKDLTAARVLGVRNLAEASEAEPAARDAAGAAAACAVSDGAGPLAADSSSHAAAGVSEAGEKRLGAPVAEEMHAAGHQSPSREERTVALSFSEADGKSSSAEGGDAEGDKKPQREAGQEGVVERQQPLVVSLAELPDLSVLEQSPERATAARRRHPQAVRRIVSSRRDLDKAKNPEAVDPEAAAAARQRVKGGRRDSAGSSVVVLEPHEGGSEEGDKCSGHKTESSLTTPKKRRKGRDEATAAEKTPHGEPKAAVAFDEKEEFFAGAREFEALCEAVGRESERLLELVTFYDNFTSDCVKCAVHDLDCSDSEGGRHEL